MRLKTYIVEDNLLIRETLINTLAELAEIDVVGMSETEEAGRIWLTNANNTWDLAIVDLFLRTGSGMGVISACRARQVHQKVVVLSNYVTVDIRAHCKLLAADDVFDKSTEIEALLQFCLAQSSGLVDT